MYVSLCGFNVQHMEFFLFFMRKLLLVLGKQQQNQIFFNAYVHAGMHTYVVMYLQCRRQNYTCEIHWHLWKCSLQTCIPD